MRYVTLLDGTRIDYCSDATTSNEIHILASNFHAVSAIVDKITSENSAVISVYDADSGELLTTGSDLILITTYRLIKKDDGIEIVIELRNKTHDEIIDEEITELQEAVLS